jgi:putative CocE/NonD family hydrolase
MTTAAARDQMCEVDLARNVVIPLADGVTLAADLHLPRTEGPFPTLISLYPYRKDDIIGSFTAFARRWFAQRGYAHLLVDVRGYGGSEGRRAESFDPLPEAADAAEVVEWAARQAWCDGAVGVWGISYGGLTALAAGVARPRHLRAIAPVYPLWDVYEDVVSPGGTPTMISQNQWSTIMLAQRLAPPTFRDPEGRWQRVWRERLERVREEGVDISRWHDHEEGDAYWRKRRLPVERIEVPTFLIGGWRDLFPQAVATAFERISAPKRLLVGPWLHVQPDLASREQVDWLQLLLGFWEAHLRGTTPAGDPRVVVFVQGAGGWRGATTWPPAGVEQRRLHPQRGGRLGDRPGDGADEYDATPVVGITAGQWDAMATGMGYPLDHGRDDLLSLTYTSAPVATTLELAGSPEAGLDVERLDCNDQFDLVAKLVDVSPGGRAELITSGWARARTGVTTVKLWATAWAVAPGHRLRLSVACADFPRTWPNVPSPRIRVRHAGSALRLPVVPGGIGEPLEPPRPEAVAATERFPWTLGGEPSWTMEHDLVHDAVAVTLGGGETIQLPEGGTLVLHQHATAQVAAAHPEGASVVAGTTIEITVPDGERVEVTTCGRAWRDRHRFEGKVTVDGRTLLEHTWTTST